MLICEVLVGKRVKEIFRQSAHHEDTGSAFLTHVHKREGTKRRKVLRALTRRKEQMIHRLETTANDTDCSVSLPPSSNVSI